MGRERPPARSAKAPPALTPEGRSRPASRFVVGVAVAVVTMAVDAAVVVPVDGVVACPPT